jgi:hypothetical protein
MNRWFRHYAGMMRDEKLVSVAVQAMQSIERVVWVWGAILESAAELNEGGRYEFDVAPAAYFLRCEEEALASVIKGLEEAGRIAGQVVCRWGERQYESDSSKDRQRRYRDRLAASRDAKTLRSDGRVTSRDGVVTAQDTDTDTEKEKERKNIPPARAQTAPKSDVNGFRAELRTILDNERIDGLVQVRRNKRAALTPYAARLLKAKIASSGLTPANAADTMILRGWISIEQAWLQQRNSLQKPKPSNGLAELADEALNHIRQLRDQNHEPANQDRHRRDVEFLPPDRRKL